jgi:hypothetical protein
MRGQERFRRRHPWVRQPTERSRLSSDSCSASSLSTIAISGTLGMLPTCPCPAVGSMPISGHVAAPPGPSCHSTRTPSSLVCSVVCLRHTLPA